MTDKNNYFSTFISVVTNPLFIILWFGFALSSYFFLDIPLTIYCHHLSNPLILKLAQIVTQLGYGKYYLGFSASAFIVFYILNRPKSAAKALFFLASIVFTGIICDILKIIFSRARPVELFQNHLYGLYFFHFSSKMWSFPSGHATTAATIMIAASLFWPRLWPAFVTAMLVIAASRVIIGVHYLSDVMIGLYLGTSITLILAFFAQRKGWIRYSQYDP